MSSCGQLNTMTQNRRDRVAIQIDMTPDGRFSAPQPGRGQAPGASPISGKIMRVALLVAAVAAAGAFASLALWLAMVLIPVAIGAGVVFYGLIRYRMWKAGISLRSQTVRGGPARRDV
jgi:hypothetical protein